MDTAFSPYKPERFRSIAAKIDEGGFCVRAVDHVLGLTPFCILIMFFLVIMLC